MSAGPARVSLLRWLRRQLRQPVAVRERLEAAVEHDDPGEVRRLLDGFDFSPPRNKALDAFHHPFAYAPDAAALATLASRRPVYA